MIKVVSEEAEDERPYISDNSTIVWLAMQSLRPDRKWIDGKLSRVSVSEASCYFDVFRPQLDKKLFVGLLRFLDNEQCSIIEEEKYNEA